MNSMVDNTKDKASSPSFQKVRVDESSRKGWLHRLSKGLEASSNALTASFSKIFAKDVLDKKTIQRLQDILIMSDMGIQTTKALSKAILEKRLKSTTEMHVKELLAHEMETILLPVCKPLQHKTTQAPQVVLVVGVNGSGKTTTVCKLAHKFRREGKAVLLVAGDTFRAAAREQLHVWASRIGCSVVSGDQGKDPAALVFEALHKSVVESLDVVLIDTAGRVHNNTSLMESLKKISRVSVKVIGGSPHDVILILDSTIGQNAMEQVRCFDKYVSLSGIIMTKLDGTAKGGLLINIASQFGLSIHAIGVGETLDSLHSLDARDFSRALLGLKT